MTDFNRYMDLPTCAAGGYYFYCRGLSLAPPGQPNPQLDIFNGRALKFLVMNPDTKEEIFDIPDEDAAPYEERRLLHAAGEEPITRDIDRACDEWAEWKPETSIGVYMKKRADLDIAAWEACNAGL